MVEPLENVRLEVQRQATEVGVQLLDRSGPHHRGGDHGVAEQPRQRDVGRLGADLTAECLVLLELVADGPRALLQVFGGGTGVDGLLGCWEYSNLEKRAQNAQWP